MRVGLEWIAVVSICCCAVGARAEEKVPLDAQLAEAQREMDEVKSLRQAGKYAEALLLAEHSLQLREKVLGPNHPDVATSLNNLAVLYADKGEYERAEPIYQRALQIREATLGKNHPYVATSLNNLAIYYLEKGEYERAEPLCQRALQILETALGKNRPEVADSLNILGGIYRDQGAYERAEPLFQRALQILETALGKNHPEVATSLNNLAALYVDQGAYERAEPLHQRALQIRETGLGKNHPRVARSLTNLAALYVEQGAYERAEPMYQRALQIRESTLGKNHPDVAHSLRNLANLYTDEGVYEQAEPLYQRALQIWESALGDSHPEVAQSLYDLAKLHVFQNHLAQALSLFERYFAISEKRLRKEALVFSEARWANLLNMMHARDEILYNLLHERPSESSVRRLALSVALLHKGRSVGEIADASRIIYRSLGEIDREAFQRLRTLRTQLASLSLSGPDQHSAADYQARLKELETQGDNLEAELAQRSSILRAQRQLPALADVITRVGAALPNDGALIEIVAFAAHPLVPPPGIVPSKIPSIPAYLALVLLPQGDIHVADLGPAAVIDSAVGRLRQALAHRNAPYLAAAHELYRLVFQPISSIIGSQRQLFIAPDGQLSLVPFATLHDGQRFLADAYDFTYLTSGKDLVRSANVEPSRSVMVFADPDFSSLFPARVNTGAASALPAAAPAERSYALEHFFRQRSPLTDLAWPPLPGTRQEAEAIRRLVPEAQLMLGAAATKEAFLQVTAPGILHVATHGYFFEDPAAPPGTRAIGGLAELAGGPGHIPPSPLLRSVLVLAGAGAPVTKASAAGKASRRRVEDSLVTALEIAGMNLWGTQLVMLAACQTGQGDVKLGQGVQGLRRAFTVAGAETLVTSLWTVDDATTREFMERYYQRLLAGQGRARALREAMETIRSQHVHPYYWAPFILVGNGAPLRGLISRSAASQRSLPATKIPPPHAPGCRRWWRSATECH